MLRKILFGLLLLPTLACAQFLSSGGNIDGNGNITYIGSSTMSGHLDGRGNFTVNGLTPFNIAAPTNGQCLLYSVAAGAWQNTACPGGGGGSGTVTSVGLVLPGIFTVSGSPVTTSGSLTATLASQAQNLVWASPNGSSGAPVFRALVSADLPAGLGTVTSVSLTAPSWLTVAGSPITSSGTLALTAATGQTANQFLATPNGSTGAVGLRAIVGADLPLIDLASGVTGLLPNANLAFSSVTLNGASVSLGGTRTLSLASSDFVNQGTTTTVLHGNAAGNPTWGAVSLSTEVSGTLLAAQFPVLAGDCTTPGASLTITCTKTSGVSFAPIATSGSASDLSAGTVAAARMPALTGDATSSAGSVATTVKQIHNTLTSVNNAASPYTVVSADTLVLCDATAGAVTLNLPAATGTGRELSFKKIDSSANACTVTRAGSDTIDGGTTTALQAQYTGVIVVDGASAAWYKKYTSSTITVAAGSNPNTTISGTGSLVVGSGTIAAGSGNMSGGNYTVTGTGVPSNGIYRPVSTSLGFSSNSVARGTVDLNGALNWNAAIVATGTKPAVTGCSNSSTLGGAIAGSYVSGTTGTCTVTITLPTGPTSGYACFAHDVTTAADYTQSAITSSVTTLTISGTTVSGDVIVWGCPLGF